MSLSSQRRGQLSPTSALVGLVVVCAAVSGYAAVLDRSLPTADRDLAPSTLTAVESALADDSGVVEVSRLSAGLDACPTGYSCRLVVAVGDERRVAGAEVPEGTTTDTASTQVSVRSEPGHVGFGTLRVEVWA
ncbi:hypothetical protein KU306_08295 [Haloferax larsenii]|uniref:Uncharacterized protein n=1 Tax=Haloferax larsenii TaxID=302484 RepID=A0ABY5R9C4_HALLR|nr:hypothetical protein [Haloferax larsenii]ELZ74326.1 hypothetical protein C455_17796 [Haloferax larsenii JCM 13917]UVE48941.1 hypothetical protein KU306_08295 [Haloferax larsenii]